MSPSRFWMFQVVLVAWLCYSLLLVGAQTEDYITDPVEVMALKAVKKSLIDPMNNLSNWNRGDPCTSNWTGVLCYNTTVGNDYLHVRELQLFKLNLSGNLSPELGRFSHMEILDFMWNRMTGSIPKEIGNITTLKLLLLNGNQLTGSLPEEIGNLPKLDRIQIDENNISGPIPKSFANLNKTRHFHMNNNSISGKIPPELSRLPSLVHFLLDNNNLSGYLPPEFSELPKLLILQVDNNHFDGSTIPASYSNMSHLLKMSLRNCGLQGPIPDLSRIPNLGYLDLSSNQLNGTIPSNKLSDNITTINLSNNNLIGPIPANFSSLPNLQRLLLANSSLNGSLPSTIWKNRTLNSTENFILDLVNNNLSTISGTLDVAANVSIRLQGNPLCSNASLDQFCGSQYQDENDIQNSTNSTGGCPSHECPPPYEYSLSCSCALPLLVEFRLKSPGFSDFRPYKNAFEGYLTNGLNLNLYQLDIGSYVWQKGPRLKIDLKFFPVYNSTVYDFNRSEVLRIRSMFTGWTIPDSELFGPHELLGFDLLGLYTYDVGNSLKSGLSKGAIAGIVLGAIASAVTLSAIVSLLILRKHLGKHHVVSKRRRSVVLKEM